MKTVIKEWMKSPQALVMKFVHLVANIIYLILNAQILLVIADAITAAKSSDITDYIIKIGLVCLIQLLLNSIITITSKGSYDKMYTTLSKKYTDKILSADYKMYVKYTTSYVMTSFEEVARICNLLKMISTALINVINVGILIFYIYRIDHNLVVPIGGIYLFLCIPITYLYKKWSKLDSVMDDVRRKRNQEMHEIIDGFAEVRSFNTQKRHRKSLIHKSDTIYDYRMKRNMLDSYIGAVILGIETIGVVITLLYISGDIRNGIMSVATAMALINYIWRLAGPLIFTLDLLSEISFTLSMIKEYENIVHYKNEEKEVEDIELTDFKQGITVKNVSFTYDSTASVLKHLSMKIERGTKVGICGMSGGGKTTLFKLLERFYIPDSGSILIDGVNINRITEESFRRKIGIVHQDNYIFDGTIYENISYGNWGCTDNDVVEATKKANLYTFIMSLPDKFNTKVGPRGLKLSGGQKQRISLARIFLQNPDIVLLDEATSALDNESEAIVQDALEKLEGKTIIMIAHRLTTIEKCDKIYVLENMGISESGTHEELLKKGGSYAALYNAKES